MFRCGQAISELVSSRSLICPIPFSKASCRHSLHRASEKKVLAAPFRRKISIEHKSSRENTSNGVHQSSNNAKRKPAAGQAVRANSLRRVAVEAERSRSTGRKKGSDAGKTQNGEKDTKLVTAYCTADQYHMSKVAQSLQQAGYNLDPYHTNMQAQVVHVRMQTESTPPSSSRVPNTGDIFIFPSGTVVAWDVDEEIVTNLITKSLASAAENPYTHETETEDLDFVEDADSETSSIVGDQIKLGTKRPINQTADSSDSSPQSSSSHKTDLILTKIAFSSGLARSVKLAVLENTLESYFKSTRSIPTQLSRGVRLPFTRAFILRKTGELLTARAQLNLNSELTDALPDMFWDSRHDLGLEDYFEQAGRALDVNVRSRVLNQKMTYAQDIVAVLREQLSERHGYMLEWLIIALISLEVGFELLRVWKEHGRGEESAVDAVLSARLVEILDMEMRKRDAE